MRLFTAVELTDVARAAVVAEQRRIVAQREVSGALKLVRPEHLHLTLVFIGEVEASRAETIVRAMAEDLPVAPFRLTFGGVSAFPPRGAPRVLILDTSDGRAEAIDLHRHTADRLGAAGVERESRPFQPHLTLGRWRERRPSDRPPTQRATAVATIEVREVVLFESRLSSSGPSYTRLTAARLEP